jgi:hypothetical protein
LARSLQQQFPEIAIELSPLESVVKTKMLKKIQAAQNAPPKPDPAVLAAQQKAQIDQQKAVQDAQRKAQEFEPSSRGPLRRPHLTATGRRSRRP